LQPRAQTNSHSQHAWATSADQASTIWESDCDSSPEPFMDEDACNPALPNQQHNRKRLKE
ncbi:hypothetical protein BAE44_0015830, partial [Dichanthelium oligosanthes]